MNMQISETQAMLNQMSWYWKDRATVKRPDFDTALVYDTDEDDFLDELIPCYQHPKFQENYEEFRSQLLAAGWLAYNEKTIDIESQIISPTCIEMIYGNLPGTANESVRWAASDTLVDESFHVLMVVNAMRPCKVNRGLEDLQLTGFNLTKQMNLAIDSVDALWEKKLIRLATSIVSEVFISDYLSLLSDADDIQPLNQLTTAAHKHDELAHSGLFRLFSKQIFHNLSKPQQHFFAANLAKPVRWFASKELDVWGQILEGLAFPHAEEIIEDCRLEVESDLSKIDFSELILLSEDVGILDSEVGQDAFRQEGII